MNGIRTCAIYKTDNPVVDPRAEFYAITLYTTDQFHRLPIYIREIHGWWNEERKRIVHQEETLRPEEGYDSFAEAEEAMNRQIQHRASVGFQHLFAPTGPDEEVRYSYRFLEQ
jgi:hypothetical protein